MLEQIILDSLVKAAISTALIVVGTAIGLFVLKLVGSLRDAIYANASAWDGARCACASLNALIKSIDEHKKEVERDLLCK